MNKLEYLSRRKPKILGELKTGELFVFCDPPDYLTKEWKEGMLLVVNYPYEKDFETNVLNPYTYEVCPFDSTLKVHSFTCGIDSETEWYE